MKSQSTIKTKIKNLILAGTLLVYAPMNMLQAVNVPPGSPLPSPQGPGCPTFGEPGTTCPPPEDCPDSFHFSFNLGRSTIKRSANYKDYSRQGQFEGQNGRGIQRNFNQYRRLLLSDSNTHATQMERVLINKHSISSELYNPNCLLFLPAPSNAKYISDNGVLQQVLTLDAFTDIEPMPANEGFYIRQWPRTAQSNWNKVDGFYVKPDTTPRIEVHFRNPDHGTANNRLLITYSRQYEDKNQQLYVKKITRLYDEKDPNVLIVSTHDGEDASTPSLTTIKNVYERGERPWDTTITSYTYRANFDDNNQVIGVGDAGDMLSGQYLVSTVIKVYEDHSLSEAGGDHNGKRLVSFTMADSDEIEQAIPTLYTYYNKRETPEISDNVHGRVKSVQRSDGTWEYWEYTDDDTTNFVKETKYSSWKNVSLANFADGKMEETMIFEGSFQRTTQVKNNEGNFVEIAYSQTLLSEETETGYLIRTVERKNGNEVHRKITAFHPYSNAHDASRPVYMIDFDGTLTKYTYSNLKNTNWYGKSIKTRTVITEQGLGSVVDGVATVTNGTRTTTTYDSQYNLLAEESEDIKSGFTLRKRVGSETNFRGRPTKWTYNGNPNHYTTSFSGPNGLIESASSAGPTEERFYDPLGRVTKVIRKASSTATELTTKTVYLDNKKTVTVSDEDTERFVSKTVREHGQAVSCCGSPEVASRVITYTPDADGKKEDGSAGANGEGDPEKTIREIIHNSNEGRRVLETRPDGVLSTSTFYLDGRPKSIAGNAVTNIEYKYGVYQITPGNTETWGRWVQQSKAGELQWEKNYYDQLSRLIRTQYADGANIYNTYHSPTAPVGSRGKLYQTTTPGENDNPSGITTTYYHSIEDVDFTIENEDNLLSMSKTIRPIPSDKTGAQPVARSLTTIIVQDYVEVTEDQETIQFSRTRTYINQQKISEKLTSIDGLKTRSTHYGRTQSTDKTLATDGQWTVTTTGSGIPKTWDYYTQGRRKASLVLSDDATPPQTFTDFVTGVYPGMVTGTAWVYNSYGILIKEINSHTGNTTYNNHLQNGKPRTVGDNGLNTTHYEYDMLGRVTKIDSPDSITLTNNGTYSSSKNIAHISYSHALINGFPHNIISSWGDMFYPRIEIYDDQNRLVELRSYKQAVLDMPTLDTQTDQVTKWSYNNRGSLKAKHYNDGTTDEYKYYKSGKILSITSGDHSTKTYHHEYGYHSGTYFSDITTTPNVSKEYDNFGRMKKLTQGNGSNKNLWTYSYHPTTHQLSSVNISYDDGTFIRKLEYNEPDIYFRNKGYKLLKNNTIISNVVIDYDNASRIHKITTNNNHTHTYKYLPHSNQIESINSPSHKTTITHHEYSNIIKDVINLNNNDIITSKFTYTPNEIGLTKNKLIEGNYFTPMNSITYDYDNYGQIMQADHSIDDTRDKSYRYDNTGNRTNSSNNQQNNHTTYQTNNLNQYTSINNIEIIYDKNGNLKSDTEYEYTWNEENRLIKVSNANQTIAEYNYDPLGRRISKTVNSITTYFVYDNWRLINEYIDPTHDIEYFWGLSMTSSISNPSTTSSPIEARSDSNSTFPNYDGEGNIIAYIKEDGLPISTFRYDPYGATTNNSSNSTTPPFLYSKQYYDKETKLYYYGHRYYNSNNGKWISRDPINERGGLNLYGFLGNSPVNKEDILGLCPSEDCPKWVIESTFVPHKNNKEYVLFYDEILSSQHTGSYRINSTSQVNGHKIYVYSYIAIHDDRACEYSYNPALTIAKFFCDSAGNISYSYHGAENWRKPPINTMFLDDVGQHVELIISASGSVASVEVVASNIVKRQYREGGLPDIEMGNLLTMDPKNWRGSATFKCVCDEDAPPPPPPSTGPMPTPTPLPKPPPRRKKPRIIFEIGKPDIIIDEPIITLPFPWNIIVPE